MGDPYRRIARIYDAVVEPFNSALRKYVLKVTAPEVGSRVLEVGCGTGSNLALFADSGCEVSGIDMSPAMLDRAKTKLGEAAGLHLGDASAMPFGDGSFDLVVAFLTIHEMPAATRTAVVSEMARVVDREGRLLLVDFHPGPYRFPKGWLYRSVIVPIEVAAGREHFRNHRDFIARNGLLALLERQGFSPADERVLAGGNIHVVLATSDPV